MDEHPGYEKNTVKGNNTGNSRNGYGKKTISSDYSSAKLKCRATATAKVDLLKKECMIYSECSIQINEMIRTIEGLGFAITEIK